MTFASLQELAAHLGTTPARLREVIRQTISRLPRARFYVFRVTGRSGAAPSEERRVRMIPAFPSPDDALQFAQRNNYGSSAQIRAISAADLLLRMCSDPSIGSVLFIRESPAPGQQGFGPGLKVERDRFLVQFDAPLDPADQIAGLESPSEAAELPSDLDASPTEQVAGFDLTAKGYDALQFGVDFTDRAEFRVALTQAIEEVVESYRPPQGGLDSGPRSIYATSAVEEWLKTHGFPHAFQRRWIDVAGDPAWGGAAELCEIDAGTSNHLLIQLLIHVDDTGRQYIGRVNVTI